MKVKSITAVAAMLALLGASSAFARSNNLVDGQEVTGKAEPAFTSTLSRAQVQDEAIKAAQDGTLSVNVSKILTIEGQPVAGVTTASDVGSSSITRAQVQEELMASRAKQSGMPEEVLFYM